VDILFFTRTIGLRSISTKSLSFTETSSSTNSFHLLDWIWLLIILKHWDLVLWQKQHIRPWTHDFNLCNFGKRVL